ncbi:PTS fructose transporter subunit IIB, partial [Klebsiella sp. CN_Kp107]|nr:PTS fructose transporter subunit IIB [Klebsiella sp. CN_Kp107]
QPATGETYPKSDLFNKAAADVKVTGEERFAGKKVVKVATETAVKSPNKLIEKLSEIVNS